MTEANTIKRLCKTSHGFLCCQNLTAYFLNQSDQGYLQNKISHGELVLLYKDADVPSISGLAEKKMPQYSRDLAHGLLHARDAVSNETVTPGLPNARALGTGAKVKILRESDMGRGCKKRSNGHSVYPTEALK